MLFLLLIPSPAPSSVLPPSQPASSSLSSFPFPFPPLPLPILKSPPRIDSLSLLLRDSSLLLARVCFVQQLPHRTFLQFELRLWGNALSDTQKDGGGGITARLLIRCRVFPSFFQPRFKSIANLIPPCLGMRERSLYCTRTLLLSRCDKEKCIWSVWKYAAACSPAKAESFCLKSGNLCSLLQMLQMSRSQCF